jgi:hypothetical protein
VIDLSQRSNRAFRAGAGRLLLLGALVFTASAQAELYKWTDGQGKVHYTDQPPTVNAETVKGPAAGQAETTSQATQSLNDQDQAYKKRRKDAEEARAKAEKEAEQARIQRENCDKARKNLSTLQNTPRTYTTNSAGQRTYMDEAARNAALATSQKAISDFCK